jgi:primosomal protein N' (replication factor Y)
MHEREIDILIGTQMIVKGYHLPGVTLVGVISADQSLGMPDYRAAERTFQILTQVAGRSGRGDLPGEVIVQTYNPSHYSVTCAARHDYTAFFEHEIRFRRELFYPPLAKLVNIRFEGAGEAAVEMLAGQFGETCRRAGESANVEVLGPARAPWEKVKGRYRFQLLLKGEAAGPLKACAGKAIQAHAAEAVRAGVKVAVDVDPMLMM